MNQWEQKYLSNHFFSNEGFKNKTWNILYTPDLLTEKMTTWLSAQFL